MGRGCLAAFFSLFLLMGGSFCLFFFRAAFLSVTSRSWREVPCTVVSSEVGTHSGSKSATFSVDIVYEYETGGRTYRSTRYGFLGGSSSGYDGKAEIVAEHPPGSRCTCFVDPANPARAVLSRSLGGDFFFVLIPLLFVAVGLGGIVLAWTFDPARRASGPSSRSIRVLGAAPDTSLGPWPVTLGGGSAVGRFFGMLAVTVFWNGIVGIFLVQEVSSWSKGDRHFGSALFLVPFVLIGLLFAAGLGYFFLALFNPRLKMTLSSGLIPAGGSAAIRWTFSSGGAGITKLTIGAEGREETATGTGRSKSTRREVFARIPVFEAPQSTDMSTGTATLSIPGDARPSFEEPGRKVAWVLKVQGEIPRWPDVSEELEFAVAPSDAAPSTGKRAQDAQRPSGR
jgi:hypothetical protein